MTFYDLYTQIFSCLSKTQIEVMYCLLFFRMYLLTGVFVSPLVTSYGCKKSAVLGSVIFFIAMVLSSVMPNVWCLFITYGFCSGNVFSSLEAYLYLFIWGFTLLLTLYRSYQDG